MELAENVREYPDHELAALVPLPADDANKYSRGTLTAVVGSERYPGAACLAAAASQRAGAGYTEVITHAAAVNIVRAWRPSLVVRPRSALSEALASAYEGKQPAQSAPGDRKVEALVSARAGKHGNTPPHAPAAFEALAPARARKPRAYLVGSGFDAQDAESASLTLFVLEETRAPVVVDGGGLDALAGEEGRRLLLRRRDEGCATVITPHAGEAARLARPLGLPADDPCALSRALSRALGVVALVKGPITYASDGEQVARMAHGTPALAKAGTGDVLAGVAGALLAQGLDALDAAVLAAELHARAGRAAAARLTDVAVTAEDVVEALPSAIAELLGA